MSEPSESRPGISRRAVLRGGAVAGAVAAGSALTGGRAVAGEPDRHGTDGSFRADLVLHNGRIHTMDDRNRTASVVATSRPTSVCPAS